jgi:hypothetical protein
MAEIPDARAALEEKKRSQGLAAVLVAVLLCTCTSVPLALPMPLALNREALFRSVAHLVRQPPSIS